MTPSGLALSDTTKTKTGDFRWLQLLDVPRWSSLARQAVPASRAGYRFTLPTAYARQTSNTGAQMRAGKVMGFASAVELESSALMEALEIVRVDFGRPEVIHSVVRDASVHASKRHAEVPSVPTWVANLNAGSEVSDVTRTIDALLQDLNRRGFSAVNESLTLVNVANSNHVHLVAILRALFRSRKQLANWRDIHDRTFQEIQSRGKNAERIMAGLNVD